MMRTSCRGLPALGLAFLLLLGACRSQDSDDVSTGASPPAESPSPGEEEAALGAGEQSVSEKLASPSPIAEAPGGALETGAVRPTDAGAYIFDDDGMTDFKDDVGCPPDRKAPTPTKLTVDPPNGNRQKWVRDRRSQDGQGLVVTLLLEYRQNGVYLVLLNQQQSTPLGTFHTEFEPNPPVLVAPYNTEVGTSWTYTLKSKDGRLTVDAENVVEAVGEAVTIGDGSSPGTTRVRRNSHIYGETDLGQVDVNETTTTWISPDARLGVQEVSQSSGRIGLCQFTTNLKSVVRAARPT